MTTFFCFLDFEPDDIQEKDEETALSVEQTEPEQLFSVQRTAATVVLHEKDTAVKHRGSLADLITPQKAYTAETVVEDNENVAASVVQKDSEATAVAEGKRSLAAIGPEQITENDSNAKAVVKDAERSVIADDSQYFKAIPTNIRKRQCNLTNFMSMETIVLVPYPWVPVPDDTYPTDNYLNKTTHIMKWTPPLKFEEVRSVPNDN